MERVLGVCGLGVVADGVSHVRTLAERVGVSKLWRSAVERAGIIDPAVVASQDVLAGLAIDAVHQAWEMAEMDGVKGERVGLIFQSAWGAVDSTVAYLESMLAEEGRYASPRHFSRSVYSSAASVTAIHFRIKGPCETLTFEEERMAGPLCQAWRMLAARRCDRVVVVWGEQRNEVATDLAKRAYERLGLKEFRQYAEKGAGYGAVAVIVGLDGKLGKLDAGTWRNEMKGGIGGMPFAMDEAMSMAQILLSGGSYQ